MKIEHSPDGRIIFEDVEPQLVQLFLAIPAAADPGGNPAALGRLYPMPVESGEAGLNEEWAQFVVPELREAFESAVTVVAGDLQPLRAGGTGWAVPPEHMDAWLSALNQTRLALAAKYNVTEEDMDEAAPYPVDSEREVAVAQIHLYGLLQECLIRYIE